MQAIIATVLSLLMALAITPAAIISMAIVVAATLRNGAQEGLLVTVAAVFVLAGVGGLLYQAPTSLALLSLVLLLPAWVLAYILGSTHSLAKALDMTAIGGFLLIGLQYLLLEAPTEFWGSILQAFMQEPLDAGMITIDQRDNLVTAFAPWMPAGIAVSWFTTLFCALLLGRWASLKLTESTTFGPEFRSLRFGRLCLFIAPFLLISAALESTPGIASQLSLICIMLLLIHGISMAHAFSYHYAANRIWLTGFYILLLTAAPYSTMLVAVLSYFDGWVDFRTRAGIQNKL